MKRIVPIFAVLLAGCLHQQTDGNQEIAVPLPPLEEPVLETVLQEGQSNAVEVCRISPDGRMLATGSWDKAVKLWDLKHDVLLRTLSGHRERVLAVEFSPDSDAIGALGVAFEKYVSGILRNTFDGGSLANRALFNEGSFAMDQEKSHKLTPAFFTHL